MEGGAKLLCRGRRGEKELLLYYRSRASSAGVRVWVDGERGKGERGRGRRSGRKERDGHEEYSNALLSGCSTGGQRRQRLRLASSLLFASAVLSNGRQTLPQRSTGQARGAAGETPK